MPASEALAGIVADMWSVIGLKLLPEHKNGFSI